MSRGLGSIEQRILREVEAKGCSEYSAEELRWALYECSSKGLSSVGKFSSHNVSFSRALSRLIEKGLIEVEKRHFLDFKECVQFYPGKTLSAQTRQMRQKFLQTLLDWVNDEHGVLPKYSLADNELHQLPLLSQNDLNAIIEAWGNIEPKLRQAYGQCCSNGDEILRLICKGRNLFRANRPSDIEVGISLGMAIDQACEGELLGEGIKRGLIELGQQFLPEKDARKLKFSSLIHSFAHVPNMGTCELRDDTLDYLYRKEAEYIEEMDGFKSDKKKAGQLHWMPIKRVYPPQLVRLFDQTVFQKFKFVKLCK